jgi:hypothetical protein
MTDAREPLLQLFADYRAEWPQPYFSRLFVPPPYFSKLETNRPCFLIGGRGTGKTIALQSLRFDAAESRLKLIETADEGLPYFGVYIRINKNRVRAFGAAELSHSVRNRAFAHYFNILACSELCRLTTWLEAQSARRSTVDLSPVAEAFGMEGHLDSRALLSSLDRELRRLELFVNNGGKGDSPLFSMAEAPIRYFAETLVKAEYCSGKLLFCCIDEYENLSAEQQAQLNTYVKHSSPPLSYKIGLRKNGLHTRMTIDQGDQIVTPADYLEIDIAEEGFESFAGQVVTHRLHLAREQGVQVADDIDGFLPDLSFDDEAKLLGCERIADEVLKEAASNCPETLTWLGQMPKTSSFFLKYWKEASGDPLCALISDWKANPDTWEVRFRNYGYASLFWLSRGRKGARIRKYYSGAKTLLALSSGNIRYFLELIDVAISFHFDEHGQPQDGVVRISQRAQTEAARVVGKRRLDQLEGLSERGIELKRLVLAIGKVFFELARNPAGRAPEQNLFVVSGPQQSREMVDSILAEGVAHLAFEATPRTKATSQAEMRDDEYRLHPIFCGFFEFSHRRKRRITFPADTLLKLSTRPAEAITEMLDNREQTESENLPEQLAMFTDFFGASRS